MASLKDWLIPRESRFFDLLQAQSAQVEVGAKTLNDFMTSWGDVTANKKKLKEIEHEGDLLTHSFFDALNASFITPLDREDLTTLTKALDDILDYTYAVANRMSMYDIQKATPAMQQLAAILHQQSVLVHKVLMNLEHAAEDPTMKETLVEIHRLENQADEITNKAVAALFREENDVKYILKMKEIYEFLEVATDKCEDAADVVRDVLVKHA